MADSNLAEFSGRVARIEKSFSKGKGFEAAGTIGRSHYPRRRRLRLPLMGPVFVLVIGVIGIKASIHYWIGPETYENKVEALWGGELVDRIGAMIMQPDPATLYISETLARVLN